MNELTNVEAWESCLESTQDKAVLIFKHSTRCPISASAYERVKVYAASAPPEAPEYFLVKVIEFRPVSNAIASALGVPHQSPQIILVKEGKALWSESHHAITAERIQEALARCL